MAVEAARATGANGAVIFAGERKVSRKNPPSGCGASPRAEITSWSVSEFTPSRACSRPLRVACCGVRGPISDSGTWHSARPRSGPAPARKAARDSDPQTLHRLDSEPRTLRHAVRESGCKPRRSPGPTAKASYSSGTFRGKAWPSLNGAERRGPTSGESCSQKTRHNRVRRRKFSTGHGQIR